MLLIKKDDLYFIQMEEAPFYFKVGRTKNAEKRLKQLQTGSGVKLRLVHVFKGMGYLEKELHKELKSWRQSGEWFLCNRFSVGAIPAEFYEKLNENSLIQDNNDLTFSGLKLK